MTGSAFNAGGLCPASRDGHDSKLARHAAAVTNTLTWAEESATRGRYADALAWLGVLDVIGEQLPGDLRNQARRMAPCPRRAHTSTHRLMHPQPSTCTAGRSYVNCPRCGLTIVPRVRGWLPAAALAAWHASALSFRCSAHGFPPTCCLPGCARSVVDGERATHCCGCDERIEGRQVVCADWRQSAQRQAAGARAGIAACSARPWSLAREARRTAPRRA
jgi:hypothetical protein